MAEFTPIETQEQFDKMIASRLERAENKIRAEYSDYDAIKEANAKLTTDFEKLKAENDKKICAYANVQATIAELNTKISGLETSQLRTRIGLEHNIPFEMISRLAGTTEEEIKADAMAMAKFVTNNTHTAPLFNNQSSGDTEKAAYKNLLGGLITK